MGRESSFWSELRGAVLTAFPGTDLQRFENRIGIGTPDVNGCAEGIEFWWELKCLDRFPARGGIVSIAHYTQEQRNWQRRRGKAGGRVGLLLKIVTPREYLFFHWPVAYEYVGRATWRR
jgi:hypothetical protein